MPAARLQLAAALLIGSGTLSAQTPELTRAIDTYNSGDLAAAAVEFARVIDADPEETEAWAWLSETALRMGDRAAAEALARHALTLDSCNSIAHAVLGNAFTPAYAGLENEMPDSAIHYLQEAVRCDPRDGDAWLKLWTAGMVEGRADLVETAMERIAAIGFIPDGILAFGRWLLETTPPDGVLITHGDWDFFPAALVQGSEGRRPDVTIVIVSLMDVTRYVRSIARDVGLPLPSVLVGHDDDGWVTDSTGTLILGRETAQAWAQSSVAGDFERPVTLAVTMDTTRFSHPAAALHLSGPGRVIGARGSEGRGMGDLRRGTDLFRASEFVGPRTSPGDRSPSRRGTVPPANYVAWAVIAQGRQATDPEDREWAAATLEALSRDAELTADMRDRIGPWVEFFRR